MGEHTRTRGVPIDCQMDRFKVFLYDEGPHTTRQLGDHFNLGQDRVLRILGIMRENGEVTYFTRPRGARGKLQYWMLTNP